MEQDRMTVRAHVKWSGADGELGRYLPGADREETVRVLENAGFKKTVDVTEVSVTLDGNAEQRYCLPDADLGDTVKALRRAGFEVVDQDVGDEHVEGQ